MSKKKATLPKKPPAHNPDMIPAPTWCKGKHPHGLACVKCVDTMEAHIAMKMAGLL